MNNPTRLLCSLSLLLAVAGCQSSPVRERLIQPDQVKPPPLPEWIREPRLPPISTDEWQAILNGRGRPATKRSGVSMPASPPTMQ